MQLLQQPDSPAAQNSPSLSPRELADATARVQAIKAWSKSGLKSAGTRADAILRRLTDAFNASSGEAEGGARPKDGIRDGALRPDAFTYAAVFRAWHDVATLEKQSGNGKARGAALRRADGALEVLRKDMIADKAKARGSPESITSNFAAILEGWSREGEADSAVAAERFLLFLERASVVTMGMIRPDTSCYNYVMNGERPVRHFGHDLTMYLKRRYRQRWHNFLHLLGQSRPLLSRGIQMVPTVL